MGSFIVEFWSRVFDLPRYISPHWWIGQVFPRLMSSYRFVDAWVLGHFLGAILLYLTTAAPPLHWLESVAVLYGALMVIEAVFYETNLLVFNGYRGAKKGRPLRVLSYRRLVITSLQNYTAIVFWFALFYRHWQHLYTVKPSYGTDQVLIWLALSFKTMTGFGHVQVEATTLWAGALLLVQGAIGVSMALLIVVSFVRLLPKPGTRDYWESSTALDDEQSLIELAKMRKDGKMSEEDQSKDAFDILCSLAAATLALRMSDAMEREKPPDGGRSYALAAIIGALSIGALCLGFAYQVFSAGTAATFQRLGPMGSWVAPSLCAGCIFLVIGCALVAGGIALAVIAAIWVAHAADREHERRKKKTEEEKAKSSGQAPSDSVEH